MHEKFGNTPKIRLERELRGDLSVPKAELPASVKSHATPNLRDYTTWKLVPMEPPKEKPVSEWALEPMEPPKESPVIMDTFSPLPSDNFAPELSSIPNTTSVIPSVTPATPHSFNTPTLSAYDAGGEQRIVNVEKDVGLSSEDIIDVRKGFGLLARIRDIKNKADGLFRIFVKNFSGLQGRGKVPDIQIKRTVVESPEYIELTEFLNFTHREIHKPMMEEAKRKRNELLEGRGIFSMSKTDFDTYFSSKDFEVRADLKQQNVGDCYLVAAIHAMSCSPHFEILCRSSMKKMPDGSWHVRIPLMSKDGQIIVITPEEILPQKNKQFLKQGTEGGIIPDLRRNLLPMKGKEGLQVLEAAFIKERFGSVDRLASEGGEGSEVLLKLGGDSFRGYTIDSSVYKNKKWEYPGLVSLDEFNMGYLDHYLENFDPEVHIATVESKHLVGNSRRFYEAKGTGEYLVLGHAYSIASVDAGKKILTLANPWDTSKPITLTFDQFKEEFSGLSAIRIDSGQLLRNMKGIEKKED